MVEIMKLSVDELHEAWPALSDEERVQGFSMLTDEEARDFFSHLQAHDSVELLADLHEDQQRRLLRELPPDDLADMVQELEDDERARFLQLLDARAREEARELLEYEEDEAGGLMTPRFARLRERMTVAEAIAYLREQARGTAEQIYYAYVVNVDDQLVGVISFRELVISAPDRIVRDIMTRDVVSIPEEMDQEEVSRIFAHQDLYCLPVIDEGGRITGIITADDVFDVVDEEATEDMHKIGGSEALDAPYLQVAFLDMLRKRAGWLVVLLLLGFFTVEVMGQYMETLTHELAVLALFIPLIISSGGNTGSQASTLVVRAMALDEVRPRDWGRVIRREITVGLGLGVLLGVAGMLAALAWNVLSEHMGYGTRMGTDPFVVAFSVACSILCIVIWGTIAGSMLPFVLRVCGADPASASAPLVATIVDASGLVIYFTVGGLLVRALSSG